MDISWLVRKADGGGGGLGFNLGFRLTGLGLFLVLRQLELRLQIRFKEKEVAGWVCGRELWPLVTAVFIGSRLHSE